MIPNQRQINYTEYYEKKETRKRYRYVELEAMSEMELLDLMPNNQVVSEHSEKMGWEITKYIAGFKMTKIIDGSWRIGYYEGHYEKPLKDQRTLFELTYVRNLKQGLVDLFLMVQNRSIKYFDDVKTGKVILPLGECWDSREELGLS